MDRENSNRDSSKDEIKFLLETDAKGVLTYNLKRSALASEMSENQKSNLQDSYQVPLKCASPEVLTFF